jgi:sulfhydrogenase subunit delta
MARPRLAVWKFASCDGCQMSLLDCEDELLALTEHLDIVHFAEASSEMQPGPYDLSLIEGSISTPEEAERIQRIRQDSKVLVTIGACATAGGVQALRNASDRDEWVAAVYPRPEHISLLATSSPVAAHVSVDGELRGCPIDRRQLLDAIPAYLAGRSPRFVTSSLCVECKRRGAPCVLVATGTPCLGPVTQAGCGALCPSFHRGCYGCFGPMETPNTASLSDHLRACGASHRDLRHAFSGVAGVPLQFAAEARRHGEEHHG